MLVQLAWIKAQLLWLAAKHVMRDINESFPSSSSSAPSSSKATSKEEASQLKRGSHDIYITHIFQPVMVQPDS